MASRGRQSAGAGGELVSTGECRGVFDLSEERLGVAVFSGEKCGVFVSRSETRLSGGLTPFRHPGPRVWVRLLGCCVGGGGEGGGEGEG